MMQRFLLLPVLLISLLSCESDETKAARFLLKGNEELTNGSYKEAIRFYTESIEKNPQYEDAYNNRGVAYYKSGQYFNAIQDYNKVILELNPLNPQARGNRVDAYLASGRNEDALRDLEWGNEQFPDSSNVDFKRGLAYFAMKDYASSIKSFNLAYQKDPRNVEALVNAANGYYFIKNFDLANQKLDEAEQLDPTEANIYNTRCMMSIAQRDFNSGLDHIATALDFDANNGIYLNNRGFLKLMTGKIVEGGKDIDRAIVADPQNAWAYRNKGIFYFMNEAYDDALRNFIQTSKIEEDMDFLHTYWAATLSKLDRTQESCEIIKAGVERQEPEAIDFQRENCGFK
jgi:tetratricopeptide (TPR) repeat protein